jgi:hypothetical protein
MANQPQQLTVPPPRTYTRTDFTALRAFVQRLPAATIARLYYDPSARRTRPMPTRWSGFCA